MSATAAKANGRARGPRVPIVTPLPTPEAAGPEPVIPRQPTKQLDAAVAAVQAEAPKFARNADGQIQLRTYKYVTLDAIVDAVLPLLVAHELVWKAFPSTDEQGRPALRYRMTHIPSGESDEDVMPLEGAAGGMQALGSAITYARRYALTAYLNLTVDPDDDGGAASPPAPRDKYAEAQAAHDALEAGGGQDAAATRPRAAAAKAGTRPATVKQRNMLKAKAKAAKLADAAFADVILVATGNERRNMSEASANRWLKMGLERLPATAVDAVIAGIAAAGGTS